MIGATTQHTANPTGLTAGYKINVIPQTATADLDGRFLPGREDEFLAEIDRLLGPGVTREFIHHDIALETTADGDLWDSMAAALHAEDPDGVVLPYCMSGGTDAKCVQQARHPLLRVQPAAAAAGARLRGHVPRHRRARPGGRPQVRRAGP